MSEELWSDVDRYLSDLLAPSDPELEAALELSAAAGLPEIQVTANQGKLLHLMARMCGARRILELGTLGGYSTIWLARALPHDGRLVTLESEPVHADVARRVLARAGLDHFIDLRVGLALETLACLEVEGCEPFDFIFLDADKDNYPNYLPWLLKFSREGTVIVADNIVRNGAVLDPDSLDTRVQGVRRFLEMLSREKRIDCSAMQMVGGKGYDGFMVGVVRGNINLSRIS